MIKFDFSKLDGASIYKLMIGAIVPRPIAFVSTLSPDGIGNLAPFSFFNGVSSQPPCLAFSITRKRDGSKKDTLNNIESTREFVVNSAHVGIAKAINQTSAEYDSHVNEMEAVGLTPVPSERVRPPRVKECGIHFECSLERLVEIGDGKPGSATLVIGKILLLHIQEDWMRDGKIVLDTFDPLSRLGGVSYGKTRESFELPRPKP